VRLGIVAAFDREARMLLGRAGGMAVELSECRSVDGSVRSLVVFAGVGAECARVACARLLDNGATALLSWGLAAGLDGALSPGSLLLPRAIIDAQLREHAVHQRWHRELCARLNDRFAVHTAPLAESRLLLSTPAQKRALMLHSTAIAADMESAAVAALARAADVPFVAIRAVSDTALTHVPPWLSGAIDGAGRLAAAQVIKQVIVRPVDWPAVSRLALGFRAARATLAGVARQIDAGFLAA
jgi:adenosylhomocysteine nucleosidase